MYVQDLPYDVWEYITTFLSSEETKKLLAVNRTLFTIAMNERYRTSTIGSLLQIDTRRNLARLADPDVASRVHKLVFKPGHIYQLVQANAKKKTTEESMSTTANKLQKIIGKNLFSRQRMEMPVPVDVSPRIPVDEAVEALLSIMGLLKELRSLIIDITTSQHWYFEQVVQDLPFFAIGWSTFRASLQSLELRVPVEDLALVLPDLSQGALPNLEAVSLWIIRAFVSAKDDVVMVDTILPFLQSHRRTLRSLILDMLERTNLSPLLLALHLPSLTHFKLMQPYFKQGEADYTGLHRFFRAHRAHLTHFEIVIGLPTVLDAAVQPYPFFSQECFTTPLPRLEHLFIDYSFSDAYGGGVLRDSVINYIHQFKSTLVSLKIGSAQNWILQSMKILVEGFISTARLKRLDISVVLFQPELLTILSANLPNLEILNVSMLDVSPEGEVYDSQEKQMISRFAEETRTLYFPQWCLRSLNMQVTGSGPTAISAVYRLDRNECKAALLEALPNVKTFCGLGRDEYYSR